MAVNRFMTPAEMPEVSFFQIPQEQMRDALLSAQYQYDDAKDKLTLIGDTSFNHLKNKNDLDLAREVYSKLDQGVNNVLSKQGDGDLRKIRGDIQSLGREVGKWYRPDGDIGKLQSNYLLYNDWYKRQVENKDLDPKYVQDAAKTIMDLYDQQGGAKQTSIYTEDLKKHFDYSKFVNDNKDMIKSTLIEREKDRLGNNGYKYTDEQIQKFITPEKIMYTMSEILQSNPDHLSSLQQRIRFGNLPKESEPLLVQTGKDKEGNPIYDLNFYNPAASAIHGAMIGLGGMEEDKTRFSIGTDEPWFKFWQRANEKADKTENTIPGTHDETLGTTQNYVNNLQRTYTGDPTQTALLLQANKDLGDVVLKTVYNEKGEIKPEFAKYFKDTKDLNGKVIPKETILEGFILSLHDPSNNGGHGVWSNDEVMKEYLEGQGFKVNATWSDGPVKKLMSLYSGFYGNPTDISEVNSIMRDEVNGVPWPADSKEIGELFTKLRTISKNNANKPPISAQIPMDVIPDNTTNSVYKPFQQLSTLKPIANSYKFVDNVTGEAGDLLTYLNDNAFDSKIVIAKSSYDPNNTNPNEPQRHFLLLQPLNDKGKPEGKLKKIEIMSKTSGSQNYVAAGASNADYQNFQFWGNYPSGNKTGVQARGNLQNASNSSLTQQDRKNFGQ